MEQNFNRPASIFDRFKLTDEEFNDIQVTYAIIEPLFADYLTREQKRLMRIEVCQKLAIAERTLYQLLKDFKDKGVSALVRQVRSDTGVNRKFKPELLEKTKALLEQNPSRSISMILQILRADPSTEPLVRDISAGSVYHHLKKSGFDIQTLRNSYHSSASYRSFEAEYINQLWQGDARHGILLPHPSKPNASKMTYLFAWVDDFSRKILFAKYYWDEKLPRLEDCLRQAVLRWGIPEKIYVDNGSAYISKQFTCIILAAGIRKIHHPPYQAWRKGKIEAVMKRLKAFQEEAKSAGFKTIEELNETLAAWIEVEYNNKIHSRTGETPNARFQENALKYPPKRITNIDQFNSFFLWRDSRIVNKYDFISLYANSYRIRDIGCGEKVEVRFDPFDLLNIHIYRNNAFFKTVKAYKITNQEYKDMPQEQNKPSAQVSEESRNYFQKIREKYLEKKSENAFRFSNIIKEDDNERQN